MIRLLLVVFCLVLATVSANAQPVAHGGSVEVMSKADSQHVSVIFDATAALKYDYGLSVEAFFMVGQAWGQAYFGPAWKPIDWLKVSLSVGGQQAKGEMGWRYASSVWMGYGAFTFFGIVEFDNPTFQEKYGGLFYLIKMSVQPLDWFKVGVVDRRGAGAGPRVDLKIPYTPLSAWCEWALIDLEKQDGELVHPDRFVFGMQATY